MPERVSAVLIGAGNRGEVAYGSYALAHPDEIRFTAVAEPQEERRVRFARAHAIPPERQFRSWEELLERGQIADTALVCTLDRMHTEPTVAALEAGYDVLLEKPMAATLIDCVRLVQVAEGLGRLLQICHVLRYASFFSTLHDIVTSGRLGEVVSAEHRENVSYWHMAHSYVRGHWRSSEIESPMLMAKCCHDLDILFWNLGRCRRLGSFGSLLHYRSENAPPGAPDRCTDGCPEAEDCAWYAPRLYLDRVPLLRVVRESTKRSERLAARFALRYPSAAKAVGRVLPGFGALTDYRGWPVSVIAEDTRPEALRRALATGPYGRCVYRCDNDVVDHQVVSMEMETGASATMVMHGHSHREGRSMRYDGTRASLRGAYYPGDQEIQIHDHRTGEVEVIRPFSGSTGATGHGDADRGLVAGFVRAVREPSLARTAARESLESHLMAFAAEEARLDGTVVAMDEFRSRAESAPSAG